MRAVKAMARMRICAGSPEPSLQGNMIMCQNLVSLPNNITFVPGKSVQKFMRDTCD